VKISQRRRGQRICRTGITQDKGLTIAVAYYRDRLLIVTRDFEDAAEDLATRMKANRIAHERRPNRTRSSVQDASAFSFRITY
jgi:hypothetical protein